jgi:LysM repeat protein
LPTDQTITIYGYVTVIPALDAGKPTLVLLDGYSTTGNTEGMETLERNTFVEATGQFVTENEIEKFQVESWKQSEFYQDGLFGTLRRENGQMLFTTEHGEELIIDPEVPADLPLPFENAFVLGVRRGNVYEWTWIDDRMLQGGGGGGGGGLGFYKLNLSGTPVPFPTLSPEILQGAGVLHTVQDGDTLAAIAELYGITVDELLLANSLTDADVLQVGQPLLVPVAQSAPMSPSLPVGTRLDSQRGSIYVNIYNQPDGSQRVDYSFSFKTDSDWVYALLEGTDLQELQNYHNRPVNIWGTVERVDKFGSPILRVERFEVPFPDLPFQILKGTQKSAEVEGETVVLFTAESGTTYVQMSSVGNPFDDYLIVANEGELVVLEALLVPDESFAGYPGLRSFSAGPAVSSAKGIELELTITADQPFVMDEPPELPEGNALPTATIENVDLIYYVTNQHWQVDHLDGGPQYLQPVWRFYGHYENGNEMEILVQALKQEYLLPQLAPYITPG